MFLGSQVFSAHVQTLPKAGSPSWGLGKACFSHHQPVLRHILRVSTQEEKGRPKVGFLSWWEGQDLLHMMGISCGE